MIARRLSAAVLGALVLAVGVATARTEIHLLALRVEFPKESPDDFTTGGNGRFDRRTPAQALAAAETDSGYRYPYDVPPHDGRFLASHLRALAGYLSVASRGEVELTWEIFPRDSDAAYQAPRKLAYYGSSASAAEQVAHWTEFLRDALAAAATDAGDLARFESFLVFNASVALQGILSAELPPLVLTEEEIARSGVTIPPAVRRAWFMPQQIQQPGGVIGMNGTFAKTFLASLGLPVLSNTTLGGLAVGGWTLMDIGSDNLIERPQPGDPADSILALGFVPALPMAWEQMRLGWLAPAIAYGDTLIRIAALDVRNTDLPRAVKVPVTADEYFLVELRRSSLLDTGKHPDIAFSLSDTAGVWLRPKNDDYDAYVPGSGALVFHVDEERIRLFEPANEINAHIERQGIELIEADGWRDVGVNNTLGNPRANEGDGSPNDPFAPGDTLHATGARAPGHPVSLTSDAEASGIRMVFRVFGTTGDSIEVRIARGLAETSTNGPIESYNIGGPIVEGISTRDIEIGYPYFDASMTVVATTAGDVWAFVRDIIVPPLILKANGERAFAQDSAPIGGGKVATFPEPIVRKPLIEPDGSIVVVGATRAIRYEWDDGTDTWTADDATIPPVTGNLRWRVITSRTSGSATDVVSDRTFEIVAGGPGPLAGELRAIENGMVAWDVTVGDSIVAPPSIVGGSPVFGPSILAAVTRREIHLIAPTGLVERRLALGRADSTDRFTSQALALGNRDIAIAGRSAIYIFDLRTGGYRKIAIPGRISGTPALYTFTVYYCSRIAVATADGWLYAVNEYSDNTRAWTQLHGDALSSNVITTTVPVSAADPPMDASRAYCVPSPVGNTACRVRFYLNARSDVAVRVYTSMGELVWEGNRAAAETTPGAENEIVWPGGTKFASGLYLVRLVATAEGGERSGATIPVGIAR